MALQSSRAVHLGVDNLGVVRHVGRLLSGCRRCKPFELVDDGDLLLLIDCILKVTVCVSKVMLMMEWFGMVKFVGRIGWVMTLLMRLLILDVGGSVLLLLMLVGIFLGFMARGILSFLTFIVFSLPFLVLWLIMMILVVLLLILVWSAGALRKRRRLVHAVRDRAFLPGPPGIWHSEWLQVPATAICADDIALWPYTPGLLVKWVSFLNSLHWPVGDLDLGVGGVSYVELLILYELWAGERLSLEKAQVAQFQCRLFLLVQALIFGDPVVLLVL